MSAQGPFDLPPSREGSDPAEKRPDESQVPRAVSLADRKSERRQLRQEPAGAVLSLAERKLQKVGTAAPGLGGSDAKAEKRARRDARRAARLAGDKLRDDWDDDDGFGPPAAAGSAQVPAAAAQQRPPRVLSAAGPARARARHWAVALSFLLLVVAPTALAAWYLWERAAPRYASTVGFSVRTEGASSPMDVLGGIVALGATTSSSSDTDILYRFIQSQEIVALVDARLDLRTLWSKGDPEQDPIFAYHPPGTIEDLHDHWERMVAVYNDTGTGLLDIEVQAFTAADAQAIAQAIFEESQRLVNELSDIAQDDTTHLAREELDEAVERLKTAREAMTRFRNETQIVDPSASIQSQMGLLSSLDAQLAQTLIDLDLLRQSAPEGDPRIEQALARVEVIEARMEEERQKLGLGEEEPAATGDAGDGPDGASPGAAFADLVGEYERLLVDQEFAQQAYIAAMAGYDAALAEGRQQSRYLAAHVEPTLAERADYPQRWQLTLLTGLFALLAWMMLTLAAYALKDRR